MNEIDRFKEALKDEKMYDVYIKIFLHEDLNSDLDDEALTNHFKKLGIKEKDIEKILLNIKVSKLGTTFNNITIILPPGAYDIKDIDEYIQFKLIDTDITFSLKPDEVTLKSIIESSHPIQFNSSLNELLGFTSKSLPAGKNISEKKGNITNIDKVHLKCDCVDGSIVNGIRESILFSFSINTAHSTATV